VVIDKKMDFFDKTKITKSKLLMEFKQLIAQFGIVLNS